jgi:type IV secretory pathway VirB10-like protein
MKCTLPSNQETPTPATAAATVPTKSVLKKTAPAPPPNPAPSSSQLQSTPVPTSTIHVKPAPAPSTKEPSQKRAPKRKAAPDAAEKKTTAKKRKVVKTPDAVHSDDEDDTESRKSLGSLFFIFLFLFLFLFLITIFVEKRCEATEKRLETLFMMWEEYYDVCVKEVRQLKEKEDVHEATKRQLTTLSELVIQQDDKIKVMDVRLTRALRTINHLLKKPAFGAFILLKFMPDANNFFRCQSFE